MISSSTLHVVATELVVGAFALAGVAFTLCLLAPMLKPSMADKLRSSDAVAHSAMLFGLLATPLAIWTGLASAPTGDMSSPVLANKMLLSLSGLCHLFVSAPNKAQDQDNCLPNPQTQPQRYQNDAQKDLKRVEARGGLGQGKE